MLAGAVLTLGLKGKLPYSRTDLIVSIAVSALVVYDDKKKRKLENVDIGILCFAISIIGAVFFNVDFKYMAPLFFADPMAALIGSMNPCLEPPEEELKEEEELAILRKSQVPNTRAAAERKKKTFVGSLAFFLTSLSIYLTSDWSSFLPTSEITKLIIGLLTSFWLTAAERLSGAYDNFALGLLGLGYDKMSSNSLILNFLIIPPSLYLLCLFYRGRGYEEKFSPSLPSLMIDENFWTWSNFFSF